MHFHDKKEETWFVKSGKLLFKYINTDDSDEHQKEINVDDIIHIKRLLPHQLIAIEESEIIEVSTTHYDYDSYRVGKGDSQKV